MKTVLLSTLLLVTVSLSEGFKLEKHISPVGEAEGGLAGEEPEVEEPEVEEPEVEEPEVEEPKVEEPEVEEPVPARRARGLWEQGWGREVEEQERYGVLAPH